MASITCLAQWVKDSSVATATGMGPSFSSDPVSGPGVSICLRDQTLEKEEKKKSAIVLALKYAEGLHLNVFLLKLSSVVRNG